MSLDWAKGGMVMRRAAKQTKEYRAALLRKKAEVLSVLGIKFDTMAGLGRVAEDDQAQISHEEFISLSVNGLVYGMLRDVNDALSRISRGEYGFCALCEEPIPEKRLRALPWARHCVGCQEEAARSEKEEACQNDRLESVGSY
jgi:DnaK suppressor protein